MEAKVPKTELQLLAWEVEEVMLQHNITDNNYVFGINGPYYPNNKGTKKDK